MFTARICKTVFVLRTYTTRLGNVKAALRLRTIIPQHVETVEFKTDFNTSKGICEIHIPTEFKHGEIYQNTCWIGRQKGPKLF